MICHGKNGPGKNGPAGPILDEKMVRPDHFWSTKNGPPGPFLATKIGPARPKMVRCLEVSDDVCVILNSLSRGFQVCEDP